MSKEKKSVRLPPTLIRYIDIRRETNKINFSQQVCWMMCISAIGFFEHKYPELKSRCQKIMKKIISIIKRPVTKEDVKWLCNEMRWFVDYIEKKKNGSLERQNKAKN
jgi:hypothetical protein